MTDLLETFLERQLASLGAVVEARPDGLHALLPEDAALALGLREEALLASCSSPKDGEVDARLGSPLVERLIEQRTARPALTFLALAPELPLPPGDDSLVLLNAVRTGELEPMGRSPARYLQAYLRLTLQADELRRAVLSLTVRLADGARVSALDLTDAYSAGALTLTDDEQAVARRTLRRALRALGPAAFSGALEAISRRARRDLLRIADYYRSLDAEMARAAQRARSPEERTRREEKRRLLPGELRARRAQVRERMSPRLEGELLAAAVVVTEADRFTVRVRRRTLDGALLLQRRAADGAVEGPACAGCGVATVRIHLCDEALHVLCPGCGRSGRIDRSRCPACTRQPAPPLVVCAEDASADLRLGGEE